MIPDQDFCAPANITLDSALIQKCSDFADEAVCIDQCKWRRGKQAAAIVPTSVEDNQQTDLTGPFFSKKFCHPVSTEKWMTPEAANCLQATDMATCI